MSKGKSTCKTDKPDAREERQLYPADFRRSQDVFGWKTRQYHEEVRGAFTKLQELFNQKKNKAEALAAWCQEYTDSNFPGLGKIAYAVPHFFIGKHSIKWNKSSFCYEHSQESDVRGDNAQSKVGRGLRRIISIKKKSEFLFVKLLNEEMEHKGEKTMFIIGNLMYENVLIWPEVMTEKRDDFQKQLHKDFPDLIVKKEMRYYTRRDKPKDLHQRGEPDITIIHESKGVIFIQVKSFGTPGTPKDTGRGKKKKEQAYKQLNEDETVFKNLFKHHTGNREQNVCKVFALPNLTKEEAINECKIQEKDGVYLLSKDDLYDDGMETAEREYNMEKLRQWWNNLPDLPTPLSPDFMKDIIARLIGTLSKPRDLICLTERTHVRTMADGIRLAGRMFKTMGLNHSHDTQKALAATDGAATASGAGAAAAAAGKAGDASAGAVTNRAPNYNRVHVKGPPGSGRTTLLILKAIQFLTTTGTPSQKTRSKTRHVIVVNIYRGSKGRPIGFHITSTIQNDDRVTFQNKVHHLPIDILDMQESFVNQVNKLFPAGGKKPDWKDVLFIVDEMLDPVHHWLDIFSALQNDFRDSLVWCADGLISNNMPDDSGFTALTTECMYRLPVSVQKVLYHADVDEDRLSKYLCEAGERRVSPTDAQQQPPQPVKCNVCTNGPTAVCVLHQYHDDPTLPRLDCVQCAEELADLLSKKMKLVEGDSRQGVQPQPSYFLPCSIVILFSIPPDFYQRSSGGANHFEINNERFSCYVKKVNTSKFMLGLQARLPVQLLTSITEHIRDLENEDHQNKIFVSWVDVFQGLERDVVVYLPGDMRKILVPGLSHNTSSSSPAVSSDQPAVAGPSASDGSPSKEMPKLESKKDMSVSYWRARDIRRYTDWDKYNLVLAATRCTSQLILLVP